VHDNPEHHAVRGDILWPRLDRLVSTTNLRPAAVFEHIRTSQQTQLDSFYRNAARSRRLRRAPDLLKELGWKDSGWPDGEMFQPLFDAALWAKLPILPASTERRRTRSISPDGGGSTTGEEMALLALANAMPQPLREALVAELAASHCGMIPPNAFQPMSISQRFMDAHVAARLIDAAAKHGAAVLLAGNGHVRTDRGVPWYLRTRVPGRKAAAVMLLEVEDGKHDPAAYLPRDPDGRPAADYVLFTPRQDRPDPCEKMRQAKP
jgi:uncharacterized iron-regulated protein